MPKSRQKRLDFLLRTCNQVWPTIARNVCHINVKTRGQHLRGRSDYARGVSFALGFSSFVNKWLLAREECALCTLCTRNDDRMTRLKNYFNTNSKFNLCCSDLSAKLLATFSPFGCRTTLRTTFFNCFKHEPFWN